MSTSTSTGKGTATQVLTFHVSSHMLCHKERPFFKDILNEDPSGGVQVSSRLAEKCEAYKAGLRSGDRLLRVQGQVITNVKQLNEALANLSSNMEEDTLVQLSVHRNVHSRHEMQSANGKLNDSKNERSRSKTSSTTSEHSSHRPAVPTISTTHLHPHHGTGPSPSRSQPILSTLTTTCIVLPGLDDVLDSHHQEGKSSPQQDASPTSIGGYDAFTPQNFKRYVTPYPQSTSSPRMEESMMKSTGATIFTPQTQRQESSPGGVQEHFMDTSMSLSPSLPEYQRPRLLVKHRYDRPSPNYVPPSLDGDYATNSQSHSFSSFNTSNYKTPSQSLSELRIASEQNHNQSHTVPSSGGTTQMPYQRFATQTTPKINVLHRKPTSLGGKTNTSSTHSATTGSGGGSGAAAARRVANYPHSSETAAGAAGASIGVNSPESANTNNLSANSTGTVRIINTPTKDVTVYRKAAISPHLAVTHHNRFNNRGFDSGEPEGTNLTRIPPNLSKSIDSSQALSSDMSLELLDKESKTKQAGSGRTPNSSAGDTKSPTRRSSEDLLSSGAGRNVPQLEQFTKIQHECCVRYTMFKPSEFERSHIIGIHKECTFLTLDRRYFSAYMDEGLPHVELPLLHSQMKIISTRKTLRLQHPNFPTSFFVMFEDYLVMRSWAAVIESYIKALTPLPSLSTEPTDVDVKNSKNRKIANELFKGSAGILKNLVPRGSKSSSSAMSSSTVSVLSAASSVQPIPYHDTETRVLNACITKCTPSPFNPDVPLFLELALDVVERFYYTTPGLYRLSPNRQILDNATQALSKSVHTVKVEECEEVFTHPKDLTSFIKTFTRSLTPRFFQESTLNAFLKYVSHPNMPSMDGVSFPSSDISRPVDINAEGVKKCLVKLWRGELEQQPDVEDADENNMEKRRNASGGDNSALLRQRVIYLCLKRLCLHIYLMGHHACDKAHRLSVQGLASMFACNWHDSTDPLIITFMNKLVAVLAEQYEWFFDEILSPISKEAPDAMFRSPSHSHLLEPTTTASMPSAVGDSVHINRVREGSVGSTSTTTTMETTISRSDPFSNEVSDAPDEAKGAVMRLVQQTLQKAKESSTSLGAVQDYSHVLKYPQHPPIWSRPLDTKLRDTVDGHGQTRQQPQKSRKFHQEIDIDAAVSRQQKKNSVSGGGGGGGGIHPELLSSSSEESPSPTTPTSTSKAPKYPNLRNRRRVGDGAGGLGGKMAVSPAATSTTSTHNNNNNNHQQTNTTSPEEEEVEEHEDDDDDDDANTMNKSFSSPSTLVLP